MGKSDSEDACTGKKYEHHAIALNLFPFSHLMGAQSLCSQELLMLFSLVFALKE
jgi:hypothetical protein